MNTQFLTPPAPNGTITLTIDEKALRFIRHLATLGQTTPEEMAANLLTERLEAEGATLIQLLQQPEINIGEYDPTGGPPLTDKLAEDYTRWLEKRTDGTIDDTQPQAAPPPAPPSPLQPLTGGPPSPPPPPAAEPPKHP